MIKVWNDEQIRGLKGKIPDALVADMAAFNEGMDDIYRPDRDPDEEDGGYYVVFQEKEEMERFPSFSGGRVPVWEGHPLRMGTEAGEFVRVSVLANNETMLTFYIPTPMCPEEILESAKDGLS